jgi:hypothetical protein
MDDHVDATTPQEQATSGTKSPLQPPLHPPQIQPTSSPEQGEKPEKISKSDRIMIGATIVIAVGTLVSAGAIYFQWREMHAGSAQTDALVGYAQRQADDADKMKDSSNRNATAAENFATNAVLIKTGIDGAVLKLQAQADKMEEARKSSEIISTKALQATIDNFHQEQRSWVSALRASGVPKSGDSYSIVIPFRNTGRTPAKNVLMRFRGDYVANGAKMVFPFSGSPIPIGNIPPDSPNSFTYRGTPDQKPLIDSHSNDVFYVYGSVTYEDVFAAKHWATYCFFVTPQGEYAYCREHNDVGDGMLPSNAFQ